MIALEVLVESGDEGSGDWYGTGTALLLETAREERERELEWWPLRRATSAMGRRGSGATRTKAGDDWPAASCCNMTAQRALRKLARSPDRDGCRSCSRGTMLRAKLAFGLDSCRTPDR